MAGEQRHLPGVARARLRHRAARHIDCTDRSVSATGGAGQCAVDADGLHHAFFSGDHTGGLGPCGRGSQPRLSLPVRFREAHHQRLHYVGRGLRDDDGLRESLSAPQGDLVMTPSSVPQTVEDFDLVILGSGEAGKYLAWACGNQGRHCTWNERDYIDGSCPNIACLPSKNIIHSAKVASYFARAEEFGIRCDGYTVNMARVTDRKRSMVKSLVDIHVRNFETSGAELVLGHGSFVGPRTIQV